jgi:hypothetical protein
MALKINDLPLDRTLDRQALSACRGGFGDGQRPYGWMAPFAAGSAGPMPMANQFAQSNNFIGQVVNETQSLSVLNTGDNSNLTALIIGGQSNSGG